MSNLKACPDCGHKVSAKAVSCPNCGVPFVPIIKVFLIIFALMATFGVFKAMHSTVYVQDELGDKFDALGARQKENLERVRRALNP